MTNNKQATGVYIQGEINKVLKYTDLAHMGQDIQLKLNELKAQGVLESWTWHGGLHFQVFTKDNPEGIRINYSDTSYPHVDPEKKTYE